VDTHLLGSRCGCPSLCRPSLCLGQGRDDEPARRWPCSMANRSRRNSPPLNRLRRTPRVLCRGLAGLSSIRGLAQLLWVSTFASSTFASTFARPPRLRRVSTFAPASPEVTRPALYRRTRSRSTLLQAEVGNGFDRPRVCILRANRRYARNRHDQ
jgi:hypothetical protein